MSSDQPSAKQLEPAENPTGDCFDTITELVAENRRLTEKQHERSGPPSADFLAAIGEFVRRGVATGARLYMPEERRLAQTLLDYWVVVYERSGSAAEDSTLLPFDEAHPPQLPDEACPYIGLRAFEGENRSFFFGRTALIKRLSSKLKDSASRALWILGESGSGKSSVVRAGLLPALGRDPDTQHWLVLPIIIPGMSPVTALRAALAAAPTEPAGAARITVITIDQFEEVFTLCPSRDERRAFYAELVELLAPTRQYRLIVTMRSDFVAEFRKDADSRDMPPAAALYACLGQCQETVGPLSREDLHEAIEQPAQAKKLTVVPEVVDRLVTELGSRRDSLPLLQFTMRRLWKEREKRHITLDAYKKVGGGSNALAYCADQVYESLEREGKGDETKRIMLRLAAALKDELEITRSRVSRREIYNLGVPAATVDEVLDRFVSAELLRKSPGKERTDDLFEVAHEALVRNWNKLSDWLNAVKHSRVILGGLLQRAVSWDTDGRPSSRLLTHSDLVRAEDFLRGPDYRALGGAQLLEEYVQASAAAVRRSARLKLVAATAAGVVITAALAAANGYRTRASNERADKERQIQARKAEASRMDAVDNAFRKHPDVASMASESPTGAMKDTKDVYDIFVGQMQELHLERFQRYPMTALYAIFSPLAGRNRLDFAPPAASESAPPTLQWSLDSRRLLVVTGGKAHIYNSGGVLLKTIAHVQRAFLGPADTDYPVLTASADGSVDLWIQSSSVSIQPAGTKRRLSTAAFSRAGSQIYIGWTDRTAGVWNGHGKAEVWSLKAHAQDVKHAIFSRNALFIGTDDGQEVRLWDCLARQRNQCQVQSAGTSDPTNPIVDIAFMGREDELLVVRARGRELCRWREPDKTRKQPEESRLDCNDLLAAPSSSQSDVLAGGATQDGQSYVAVHALGAISLLYPKAQLLARDSRTEALDASGVKVSPDGTLVAVFPPQPAQGSLYRLDAWLSESSAGAQRKGPGAAGKIAPAGKLVRLAWSPDSQLLATLAQAQSGALAVQFWLRDGTPRFDTDDHLAGALYGHGGTITSLRFCQFNEPGRKGNGVFSFGLDGRPYFWDLAKGMAESPAEDPAESGARGAHQRKPDTQMTGTGQHLRTYAEEVIRESSDCRYAAIFSPPGSVKLWERGAALRTILDTDDEPAAQHYRNGFFARQTTGDRALNRLILLPQQEERADAHVQVAFVDIEKDSPRELRPQRLSTQPQGRKLGYCRSPDGHYFVSYPVGNSQSPSAYRWQTFSQQGTPAVMPGQLDHAGLIPGATDIEIVDCEVSARGQHVVTVLQESGANKKLSLWYWNFGAPKLEPTRIYDSGELHIGCGSEPPTIWMSLLSDEKQVHSDASGCFEDKEMVNLLLSCGGKEATLVRLPAGRPGDRSVYKLSGHGGNIMDADLSPDGRWAATGSLDRTVRLWPLEHACRHSEVPAADPHTPSAQKPMRRLFEAAVLRGHQWDVTRVAFSKDSKHLVSGSTGRTLRLWPTPDHLLETLNTLARGWGSSP